MGVATGVYVHDCLVLVRNAGVKGGEAKEGVAGSGKGLNGGGVHCSVPIWMRGVNVGDGKVGVSGRGGNVTSSSIRCSASRSSVVNGGEQKVGVEGSAELSLNKGVKLMLLLKLFIIGVNGGDDRVGVEGSVVVSSSGVMGRWNFINGVTGGEAKVGDSEHISCLERVLDRKGVYGGEGRVGVSGSPDSSKAIPLWSNFMISKVS